MYQQVLAGKPRLAGARAALEYFGVPDADWRTEQYAAVEHEHVVQFIEQGRFRAFPDALRFILAVQKSGIRVAAHPHPETPSCSSIGFDSTPSPPNSASTMASFLLEMTLEELFDADISGRDFSVWRTPTP